MDARIVNIRKHRSPRPSREGCGFLALTCVFSCFFLILNCALVARFYPELAAFFPRWMHEPKIEQMIKFMAPVLLIFVQWWVVDFAADLLAPAGHVRQNEAKRKSAEPDRTI